MVLNYFFILLNFLRRNIKKKKLFILNAEKRRKKKINCISILIVLVFPLNKVKWTQRGGIKIREEENFFLYDCYELHSLFRHRCSHFLPLSSDRENFACQQMLVIMHVQSRLHYWTPALDNHRALYMLTVAWEIVLIFSLACRPGSSHQIDWIYLCLLS